MVSPVIKVEAENLQGLRDSIEKLKGSPLDKLFPRVHTEVESNESSKEIIPTTSEPIRQWNPDEEARCSIQRLHSSWLQQCVIGQDSPYCFPHRAVTSPSVRLTHRALKLPDGEAQCPIQRLQSSWLQQCVIGQASPYCFPHRAVTSPSVGLTHRALKLSVMLPDTSCSAEDADAGCVIPPFSAGMSTPALSEPASSLHPVIHCASPLPDIMIADDNLRLREDPVESAGSQLKDACACSPDRFSLGSIEAEVVHVGNLNKNYTEQKLQEVPPDCDSKMANSGTHVETRSSAQKQGTTLQDVSMVSEVNGNTTGVAQTTELNLECTDCLIAEESQLSNHNISSAMAGQPLIQTDARDHFEVGSVCTSFDAQDKNHITYNSKTSKQRTEAALQLGMRIVGFYFLEVAQNSSELSSLLHVQGRLLDADVLLRQALTIHEHALGSEHPQIAADCDQFGSLLRDCGQLREAAQYFRRSLEISEQILDPWDKDIAVKCSNLGFALKDQGELNEAEYLFLRALMILEKARADDPAVSLICRNLGQVLIDSGRAAEADQFFCRASSLVSDAAVLAASRSPGRPTENQKVDGICVDANDLNEMHGMLLPCNPTQTSTDCSQDVHAGCMKVSMQDVDDRNKFIANKSVTTADDILTTHHMLPAGSMTDAMHTPLDLKDPVQQIETALQLGIDRLSFYTSELAQSNSDSSSLLHCREKLCTAESALGQALMTCDRALTSEDAIVTGCDELGHLLRKCSQLHHAARLLQQSLAVSDEDWEAEQAEIAARCRNLGLLLKAHGEPDQAEPLFRRALMILENCRADDFDVAVASSNLGQVLRDLGELVEAEELFKRALVLQARRQGDMEFALEFALERTTAAQLLKLDGQLEQAEGLLTRALRASERCFGSDHPIVVARCSNLGKLHTLRNKYKDVQVLQDLVESLVTK